MALSVECILLGSVSSQQRFGVMDIKASSMSQLSGLEQTVLQLSGLEQTVLQLLDKSVLQLRVTSLFYLDNNRKTHPRGVRACLPKDGKRRAPHRAGERETPQPFGSSFYMFFLPLGLPYVKWASQECLFYLRSSLRSSDFPLLHFLRLFPSLSFSHHHSGFLFPILTT